MYSHLCLPAAASSFWGSLVEICDETHFRNLERESPLARGSPAASVSALLSVRDSAVARVPPGPTASVPGLGLPATN